ncbi:glycoside hydrolase family 3 N-terminal domain-containing protein [Lacrimispora sp.]|uniref:glycoside hydrolase family 3 C-terminal domain-containing protein n=1 Tax=Lacrimispora sp. TaxID=2719234 RepID=UPI0034606F17
MKIRNKGKLIKWTSINAILLIAVIVVNLIISQWTLALDLFLGQIGGGSTNSEAYASEYSSDEELKDAVFAFSKTVGEESVVLMKNDNNTLPLTNETQISIFGANVKSWCKVGGGSGNVDTSSGDHITLRSTLENAGLAVNSQLYDYYETVAPGEVSLVSWNDVASYVDNASANKDNAAFFVISNQGTEGADLAADSLTLTEEQLGMLKGIREAGYGKIVLVLNTANAIEMEFLNEADVRVDAIVWAGLTGAAGLDGFGPVIAGTANPSGKLVDTYAYNHSTNPVSLNFNRGTDETRYTNADALKAMGASADSLQYVNYGESIYLGYKYYETRYADLIKNQYNAGNGGFEYEKQVAFPFGYGLSYTQFDYSNMNMSVADDIINIILDVTNSGSVEGKNVVEIYYQAPYTDYDKENLVEKSAVNLVNFVKTPVIPAGETVSVTVSFSVSDMKSYDAHGEGTYIMDNGDYYIAAAHDAHDAINSILVAQGEAASGNKDAVTVYAVDDFRILNADDATGNKVFNLFNDLEVEEVGEGTYGYLSRQDWSRVDDESIKYTSIDASEKLLSVIAEQGWNAAKRPLDTADLEYQGGTGTESSLVFADMAGLDYDDPKWEELLNKISISEMHAMFARAGYTTAEIPSIEKNRTTEYDGPAGIKNYISGWSGFCYPVQITLASTWNVELLEKMGDFIAEEGQRCNTQGWYAPSMNIHRSPYSGRNFEYYSEDGMLSGLLGAAECKGAEEKGMFVYIKHFVVNDAEQNRNGINTYMTEQALREIYTKPFEVSIKRGSASGVMGSMNRIGARMTVGSWALMTGLLRNEWGFHGGVVTDFALGYNPEISIQALAAGTNLLLNTTELNLPTTDHNYIRNALRDSTHEVLYMTANSIAVDAGAQGFPVYLIFVILFDLLVALVIFVSQFLTVKECCSEGIEEKTSKKYMKIKLGMVALFVVVIAAIGIYAFAVWSSRQL